MRNYRTQGNLTILDGTSPVIGAGGGCFTVTTENKYFDTGENGGSGAFSPPWFIKDTMNLVRFEMTGSWFYVSNPYAPLRVKLRNSPGDDYLVQFEVGEDGLVHRAWTAAAYGSLSIESGTSLQVIIEGGGELVSGGDVEYFANAQSVDLVISAWFDGSAGGGLLLHGQPGS